jgi:hypothetical protein
LGNQNDSERGWIGVDLDGTLAFSHEVARPDELSETAAFWRDLLSENNR